MGSLSIQKEFTPIRTEACEACVAEGGDTEGNHRTVYEDGSYHCWKVREHGLSNADVAGNATTQVQEVTDPDLISNGVFKALDERGISLSTVEKFNVRVGQYAGTEVVIYPAYRRGVVIRQKVRGRYDKALQVQLGKNKSKELFGKNCFTPSDRIGITITEGEYDAMCIHQATGYPAVSSMVGGGGTINHLKANLDWLMQWKHVNLCFDMDEVGKKAVQACVGLFEAGKVRIVSLPLKDANEMVLAGRSDELKKCLWDASIYRPQTLVSVEDIWNKVLQKPEIGQPWPFPSMTEITYGLRWGEVYLLAAAAAIGKTQFLQELVIQQLNNDIHVGLFFLEQTPADTMRRFVGGLINKRLHLPGADWDDAEVSDKLNILKDKIVLCDKSSGKLTLESVIINIRYAHACFGTKFFVVDNLKKLAACPTIEGQRVNRIQFMGEVVTQLSNIATELDVTMFIVQHLNSDKPNISVSVNPGSSNNLESMTEGLSYESGRMPGMLNIYGAGDITDLVDHVIVLARNRTSEDIVTKCTTTVKFIKTRLDGTMDGRKFKLYYSPTTGKMSEDMPEDLEEIVKDKAEQVKKDEEILS